MSEPTEERKHSFINLMMDKPVEDQMPQIDKDVHIFDKTRVGGITFIKPRRPLETTPENAQEHIRSSDTIDLLSD